MPSVVDICNRALILIGADTIMSLTEDTEVARYCNAVYEQIRDEVLRAHVWNCCLARASLPRLSESPAWGYSYQYQLPSDCLRVVRFEDLDTDYKIEGRKLLTNASSAKILYIKRETDPNQYDPLLIGCIAARLAAELAYPIANSADLAKQMWALYERKLAEAKAVDGGEGKPEEFEVDEWLESRL